MTPLHLMLTLHCNFWDFVNVNFWLLNIFWELEWKQLPSQNDDIPDDNPDDIQWPYSRLRSRLYPDDGHGDINGANNDKIRSDQTKNAQINQLISMEGFLVLFLDGQDWPQMFLRYLDHLSLILFICENESLNKCAWDLLGKQISKTFQRTIYQWKALTFWFFICVWVRVCCACLVESY